MSDDKVEKVSKPKPELQDVIFKCIDRPEGFTRVRCMNVFEDRWRVNIYHKAVSHGMQVERIHSSYFVRFNRAKSEVDFVLPKL